MTYRPILFSGPMVQALLDGRKTQTRRLLKPQPQDWVESVTIDGDTIWCENEDGNGVRQRLPIATGDRLWVRETIVRSETDQGVGFAVYAADHATVPFHGEWWRSRTYIPSIHMCRADSRLTLTVTDVRVQRLHDIDATDAHAEGMVREYGRPSPDAAQMQTNNEVQDFAILWDSLNAARAPWASNPWVAAYTFTVQRGNIDEVML